ncbi:MAG: methyltransferase domain-containing protein [Microscillaceae bacterium]|nr:methyltransferase domain-containing protein [Microscillaceae bacterium]
MANSKFAQRSYEAELMDDLSLSGEDLRRNLDELAIINYWLGGNQVIISALDQLLKKKIIRCGETVRLADLGSGGGDLLRLIARWARKKKVSIQLTGIDANDFMLDYSRQKSRNYPEINYIRADVFSEEFIASDYDLVTCSLFCHHFTDEQLVVLFSKLHQESQKGFIINDLHRHWFAYYSIRWLTRIFRGSYLVQHDAPLSVRRAFKKEELVHLMDKSGTRYYQIRWLWAFRYRVICLKKP